jgi:hypothetical protein
MARPYRIGGVTAGLMIGTAIAFDAVQGLLTLTVVGSLLSFLVTIVAGIIFALWFMFNGVSIFGQNAAKKALISLSSFVVELVPLIDALPAITFGVVALIAQARTEDMKKNAQEMSAAKARALARAAAVAAQRSRLMQARRAAEAARKDGGINTDRLASDGEAVY